MTDNTSPMTASEAYKRLRAFGYTRQFVSKQLPEWWDNDLLTTSAGVLQFALIIQQRLGLHTSFDKNGLLTVDSALQNARFKHRRDTTDDELSVAANLGRAIANLSISSVKNKFSKISDDAFQLRKDILNQSGKSFIDFDSLLSFCWRHGIPVLFLSELPRQAKRMSGMAALIDGRPSVILGLNTKHKSRLLFILAHELGHILRNHVASNSVLVDEELAAATDQLRGSMGTDNDRDEKEADQFALNLIRGTDRDVVSEFGWYSSPTTLALSAMDIGEKYGIEPGHLILSYAFDNDAWIQANNALSFIDNSSGAKEFIKQVFFANTNFDLLSESNTAYLLKVQGFSE